MALQNSSELCLVLLTWNAIAAFSEECVASQSVATLLSSCTRTLAIGSRKSEKRELQGSADAAINDLNFWHRSF